MDGKTLVKQCRVCGDVALGFNFNGLSCESCKAFFRRNAQSSKSKSFRCRKNGSCHIDKKTRKFCKACRLEKCLRIGMRKELIWIHKDDSKKDKQPKEQPSTSKQSPTTSGQDEEDEDSSGIRLENTIHLKVYELEKIREVTDAMAVFKAEKSFKSLSGNSAEKNLHHQVVDLAETYVNKIIIFCRKFSAFKCLKQDDQLTLLKCFYPEIAAVCAAFLYNVKRDGLPVLMNEVCNDKAGFVKLENFTQEMRKKDMMPIFRNFVNSMNDVMEGDVTIRNLILSQLLFKPRESLSCPEYMRYNYRIYCHLLKRYLQHKYQDLERAEEKYSAISRHLNRIDEISTIFREVYLNDADLNKTAQVLGEIYSLM